MQRGEYTWNRAMAWVLRNESEHFENQYIMTPTLKRKKRYKIKGFIMKEPFFVWGGIVWAHTIVNCLGGILII